MNAPNVLVLDGYGLNCAVETADAFRLAGARPRITHLNDVIADPVVLKDVQILAGPGGFSNADHPRSGLAYGAKLKDRLQNPLKEFFERDDTLSIWICNGCQIITAAGFVPALGGKLGEQQVALVDNEGARYIDRWVDVRFRGKSPWTQGLGPRSLPIAHGEGRFEAPVHVIDELATKNMVAATYTAGEMHNYRGLPVNPTGTREHITAITDESGRHMAIMPHPERAVYFHQRPDYHARVVELRRQGLPVPTEGPGLDVFRNSVAYCKK